MTQLGGLARHAAPVEGDIVETLAATRSGVDSDGDVQVVDLRSPDPGLPHGVEALAATRSGVDSDGDVQVVDLRSPDPGLPHGVEALTVARSGVDFDGDVQVVDLRSPDPGLPPGVEALTVARSGVDFDGDVQVVDISRLRYLHRSWQKPCKRAVDIVGALVALIALSPVFVISALAVAFTSAGPVFFRQARVGHLGKEFDFIKFRSMYLDAEIRKADFEELNHHDSGPIFKIREDPRITPVGRIMRKLSIDELPQLFHVLTGEMSLVGPRPPLPAEVATYRPYEYARLLAKPGMTCIWQVSGRSDLDFGTWMRMDIAYIAEWSLWLDLKLLVRTIPAVLTGRGAY